MVTVASDNPFPSILMVEGDPEDLADDPAAGQRRLAVGTDHLLYLVDDAGVATEVAAAAALTDHTHAATGSGGTGGGATLDPVNLNIRQAAPATTDGRVGWDTTYHALLGYDTVRSRPVTPAGFAPWVTHPALDNTTAFTSSRVLAAVSAGNAGAVCVPVFAPTPFFPYDFKIISNDTATARAAEIRLYADILGNAANLTYVPNTAATFSFTPSAAAAQSSTAITAAGLLPAGWYYAVLRNTSATQTFSIGSSAGGAALPLMPNSSLFLTAASVAALGSTIDVHAWSGSTATIAIMIRCLVMGQATPTFGS